MLLVNKGVHLGRFYARKNCNPATYDSWHLVVKFTIVYAVVSFWSLASGCFRWGSFISRILSNAYDYGGDGDCSRTAQTQAWRSDAALPDARWTTDLPSSIRRLYDHYHHRHSHRRRRRLITCRPPGRRPTQACDGRSRRPHRNSTVRGPLQRNRSAAVGAESRRAWNDLSYQQQQQQRLRRHHSTAKRYVRLVRETPARPAGKTTELNSVQHAACCSGVYRHLSKLLADFASAPPWNFKKKVYNA